MTQEVEGVACVRGWSQSARPTVKISDDIIVANPPAQKAFKGDALLSMLAGTPPNSKATDWLPDGQKKKVNQGGIPSKEDAPVGLQQKCENLISFTVIFNFQSRIECFPRYIDDADGSHRRRSYTLRKAPHDYDESTSQGRIERKIQNAPAGQGTVRMLSREEWEKMQGDRSRTPFESKLARSIAPLRTGEPLHMDDVKDWTIDVLTDALLRMNRIFESYGIRPLFYFNVENPNPNLRQLREELLRLSFSAPRSVCGLGDTKFTLYGRQEITKMVEVVVSAVLEKLIDVIAKEAVFKEQFGLLRTDLEWIRSFLKDADGRRRENNRVKVWLNQIRDVTYDAEDVIDTFLIKIEQLGSEFRGFLGCYLPSRPLPFFDIRNKIEEIIQRIERIGHNKSRYGIEDMDAEISGWSNEVPSRKEKLSPIVEEVNVVGFEDDVKTITRKLIREDTERRLVISIVGMGGLGKTTVAKIFFNSSIIK
ncbi:hypothetical protein HHK36_030099 [Tetracentron sinense]|uniref:Uncharacterized protein n=1 Tax=Tetracentron sinense TaxID=13715 RepID=A0A834YGI6_TETSI|nr:hypothetical protein HHK36_030099 [Tetracentron sinense]